MRHFLRVGNSLFPTQRILYKITNNLQIKYNSSVFIYIEYLRHSKKRIEKHFQLSIVGIDSRTYHYATWPELLKGYRALMKGDLSNG